MMNQRRKVCIICSLIPEQKLKLKHLCYTCTVPTGFQQTIDCQVDGNADTANLIPFQSMLAIMFHWQSIKCDEGET